MKSAHKERLSVAVEQCYAARDACSEIADELEQQFDSRSERWQGSDKGQQLQTEIDALRAAEEDFNNVLDTVEELSGK